MAVVLVLLFHPSHSFILNDDDTPSNTFVVTGARCRRLSSLSSKVVEQFRVRICSRHLCCQPSQPLNTTFIRMDLSPSTQASSGCSKRQPKPSQRGAAAEKDRQERERGRKILGTLLIRRTISKSYPMGMKSQRVGKGQIKRMAPSMLI